MLEQIAYEVPKVSETKQQVYEVGDLESLSASVLYTGHLPPMGPGGFGVLPSGGKKDPLLDISGYPSQNLSIEVPKVGMTFTEGLIIKSLTSGSFVLQEDFGGVGNIYTSHPNGNGSTRFYGTGKGKARETKEIWEII